jgi:hypothetical protein
MLRTRTCFTKIKTHICKINFLKSKGVTVMIQIKVKVMTRFTDLIQVNRVMRKIHNLEIDLVQCKYYHNWKMEMEDMMKMIMKTLFQSE